MVEEAYVSFEIAKLLKDKGFCGQYNMYYIDDGKYICDDLHDIKDYSKSIAQFTYLHNTKIPAPTQQMAMRWLREVHNIIVEPNPVWSGKKWEYQLFIVTSQNAASPYYEHNLYKSYEECVEAAIKYCLEKLI